MRSSPYPNPPSPSWTAAMVFTYSVAILMGAWTLAGVLLLPQTPEGAVTLGLWGGTSAIAGAACLFGLLRKRYRYEWIGAWLIVLGTVVYLLVTAVGVVATGALGIFTSGPTLMYFLFGQGLLAARAIWLSVQDMEARKRVQSEKVVKPFTGEFPEVRPDES